MRRHLDALAAALVVRVLQPWYENLGKRQVKAPKVYVRDTGVAGKTEWKFNSCALERQSLTSAVHRLNGPPHPRVLARRSPPPHPEDRRCGA